MIRHGRECARYQRVKVIRVERLVDTKRRSGRERWSEPKPRRKRPRTWEVDSRERRVVGRGEVVGRESFIALYAVGEWGVRRLEIKIFGAIKGVFGWRGGEGRKTY
jgi:hypothetical protein